MGMLGLKPRDTGLSDAERAASEEAGEEPGCMQVCSKGQAVRIRRDNW